MVEPKQKVCKKIYIDAKGNEYSTLPADPSKITELQFRFLDDANTVRSFKPGNYPKGMLLAFSFFGGSECLGNSYAGVSGDAIAAIAAWDKRNTTIVGDNWSSRAGAGIGKTDSMLAEAMLAYFADEGKDIDKNGARIDAAWVRSFLLAEDMDDDKAKETRSTRKKSWMANEGVRVHYERVRAEREAKKAATVEAAGTDDI